MKTHTSGFKEQIKLIGKEIDSRITFGSTVLGKNDLNAVTPSYQGAILKSVMKQLDIDSNVAIPIGTNLKYEFGLKVNGEYEYINYGNYVVYSVEKQEDTNSYKITCYDKLLYSMLDYVKLPITYPISIRDYINSLSAALGLKFANKSETFANYDKQIQADLYDGLGYTFRDVLDELAQVTASTICLNNNDELEIRYITETGDTIDEEFLKDVNVNFGEKFGAVNTIVLSRSGDSDSVYYPSVLPANPYEIKISDNQIMNGNDRADFLPDIYNKLNGLEFYTNDFVSTGIIYYDLCDRYSVKVGDNTYSCVMFNDEVLVTKGLEENIYTELPEQTETDYKHASKDDRMINQVYIIAKKNEAEILAVVNTTKQLQKEINPTKDESGSNITIEDASNNPLTYLEVEGKSTQKTRSGKNLLNFILKTQTVNGLTITNNEDGSLILNGTTTDTVSIQFSKTMKNLIAGDYYFSINATGSVSEEFIKIFYGRQVGASAVEITSTRSDEKSFSTNTNYDDYYLWLYIKSGITFTNYVIKPQLELGSTATEYEKYGASPSPDFPSEIESVGYENLFKPTLVADDGKTITVAFATVELEGDEFVLTCKNGTDMYFGQVTNEGQSYNGTKGNLIDVSNCDNISYKLSNNLFTSNYITYYDENLISLGYVQLRTVENTINLLNAPTSTKYITFRFGYSKATIGETYRTKVQIEKGSTIHSYVPYGKYGIEVKTTGKNLFNNSNIVNGFPNLTIGDTLNYTNSGVTVSYEKCCYVEAGNEYTISYIKNTPASTSSRAGVIVDENNKILQGVGTWSNSTDIITFTANYSGWLIFSSDKNTTDIQIEKGTATEYEEYKENISLIELNEPLRSLPNEVKDKAYIKNNKLYVDRYIGSVVLDGSENWERYGVSIEGEYRFLLKNINAQNQTTTENKEIHCNILENISRDEIWVSVQGVSYLGGTDNGIVMFINETKNMTLEQFKTWLSTNNVQVDYELATPITEEYGEFEMLKTLKGYNNISTTDKLLPIINLTYVRDTVIADYVENHITELKLTENEIKASVESVNSSVGGLNTTINRVEEITNDNSQVINVISTNIDKTSGEVREVTTTTGFKFNADGMTIDDGSGFKGEHTAKGTFYKDGETITGQYTKDNSKQKDLYLFGSYYYGMEKIDDTPIFIGQLYTDGKGEQGFGHFYNGEG